MLCKRFLDQLTRALLLTSLLCAGAQIVMGQNSQKAADTNAQASADGVWKDNATGLIWATKDNGSDINWNQARDYCESLRTGGDSDWRLPTVDELSALYDAGLSKQYKIKGPIQLGNSCALSASKNNSGEVWSFCFNYGGQSLGPATGHGSAARALCVRSSAK